MDYYKYQAEIIWLHTLQLLIFTEIFQIKDLILKNQFIFQLNLGLASPESSCGLFLFLYKSLIKEVFKYLLKY